MKNIKIINVSRKYVVNKKDEFYALRNISLTFENMGFVSIVGKSGSGKSTIINLISGLDKPTEGLVKFDNINVSKLKDVKRSRYYKTKIGILFQNYNLLENEDVIFNVTLPMIMNGTSKGKAKKRAVELLKEAGIGEELFKKKTSLLSGGEKQRVALARTLANSPEVVLCDEPTGALDSENSKRVISALKEYSKSHLVIMVSHNLHIVNKYSDRIIEISEGRIKSDTYKRKNIQYQETSLNKIGNSSNWIDTISFSNFKRRFKRNLFSFFALSISLISTFVSVGFINGKDNSVNIASGKQFDFGSGSISNEEEISSGSVLTLTRTVRPTFGEMEKSKILTQNFIICPNFDAILPIYPEICYDEKIIKDISYSPIYSFDKKYVNRSLLSQGYIPIEDSLNEVVINNRCYEALKDNLNKDPLYEYLDINVVTETTYVDFDNTYISDNFYYAKKVKIAGVVTELDYLQSPRIYYSFSALEEYMHSSILVNLSTYNDTDITWFDRIMDAENFDMISSYSYRLFFNDVSHIDLLYGDLDFGHNLSFTSSSLLVASSLRSFMEVAKYGLLLFLAITIIGTILIIGIISFTSYSEDHKSSAILTCLGATESQICSIYLDESLLIGLFSAVISFVGAVGLSKLINIVVSKFINLENLVVIPTTLFNVPFLFPLIASLICLIICFLVTSIPIVFSKSISLKEELQSL